jgi:hypothetical protein
VFSVTSHWESGGSDGFNGAGGIAFDARNLNESADGITGQPEVVFHADAKHVKRTDRHDLCPCNRTQYTNSRDETL